MSTNAAELLEKEEKSAKDTLHLINFSKTLKSKKLDLSRKKLYDVPTPLLELNHLEFLYLEGNCLLSLPENFFTSLTKLKWLDLRKNQLKYLPSSIGESRCLRSLLLEDNKLERLPLELGLVRSLSGLHVAENPLEFPPPSVIELGTQAILGYLRDHLNEKINQIEQDDLIQDFHYAEEEISSTKGMYADERVLNFFPKRPVRRSSDPLTMASSIRDDNTSFRIISSALSSPSSRAKRNHEIAERIQRGLINNAGKDHRKNSLLQNMDSAMLRKAKGKTLKPLKAAHNLTQANDRAEIKIQEEMEMAEKKIANIKINAELQKVKNRQQLSDWRKETQKIQRQKNMIAARHGIKQEPLEMPYGTENQVTAPATKHGKQVKEALENSGKLSFERMKRDKEIIDKIEDHMRKMRITAASRNKLKPAEEVEEARKNLQEALNLQRQLEEQRALEYRLRAFTGDEYAPPSHAAARDTK